MARTRSDRVHTLKAKLLASITDGFHRPGERFLSTRAVASRYGVSYQTADVLIRELESEGYLKRRQSSGTYISGKRTPLRGVQFCMNERARRPGSFGANLLKRLEVALRDAGIASRILWLDSTDAPSLECFPVMWEVPALLMQIGKQQRHALLLNDRPPPGMEASMVDAIATDDFSAGVCAAQVLRKASPKGNRFVVVAGPPEDPRNQRRVAGFNYLFPNSKAVQAGGWYFEDGLRVAARALRTGGHGVFCVNDRLAEGVIEWARKGGIPLPPIVGHDNAPVAEPLHLTTIALPWEDIVSTAVDMICSRMAGDSTPARQVILAQRPMYRLTA